MRQARNTGVPTEKALWYMRWFFLGGLVLSTYSQGLRDWQIPAYLVLFLAIAGNLVLAAPLFVIALRRDWFKVKWAAWILDIATPVAWGLLLPDMAHKSALWIFIYPVWATALRSDWFWGVLLGTSLLLGYILRILFVTGNVPANQEELLAVLQPQIPTLFVLGFAAVLAVLISHTSLQAVGMEEEEDRRALLKDRQQVRAFHTLTAALSMPDSFHMVLHALTKAACTYLGDKDWTSLLLLFDQEDMTSLRLVSGANYRIEDEQAQISPDTGTLRQVLLDGTPAILFEPDPLMTSLASLKESKILVILPLQSGFDEYGVLILSSSYETTFSPEHLDLLKVLCQLSSLVLHNVQLHQDLQHTRDGTISEDEVIRRQLARNLHDGPVQTVAAIAMQIEYTKTLLQREPDQVPAELDELYDMAIKASHTMRTLLFTLRPVVLETEGLSPALQQLINRLREERDLDISFEDMAGNVRLRPEAEETAFVILEEAINNAKKYAHDAKIIVRLLVDGDFLVAQVEDHGPGFDVASVMENYHERTSLGMLNMKERAALIDANWNIDSAPGKGTLVSLAVPIATHHHQALADVHDTV